MKTEITEKERQAIEESARKYCNIKSDLVIDEEERYYKDFQKYDGFKAGAGFALYELRKPSESVPTPDLESYRVLGRNTSIIPDRVKQGQIIPEPIGQTDEELTKGIESVIELCRLQGLDNYEAIKSFLVREITERVRFTIDEALLSSSRCQENDDKEIIDMFKRVATHDKIQENDVNVKLLEAFKIMIEEFLYPELSDQVFAVSNAKKAITNYEKQIK